MFEINEKVTLQGIIEKIVFKSENNDYKICRLKTSDSGVIETIFGNFFDVNKGENVQITGEYVNNPKYGRQIKIEKITVIPPTSDTGIEKYIGSGLIPGIGPVMAKKIVQHFGKETLCILDDEIEKLSEIEGFGKKRIKNIKKEWKKQAQIRDTMIFLQSLEITPSNSAKILKKYGDDAVSVVKNNPYRLCEDIFGIGFKTADRIALKSGINKNSPFRISAGIKYILKKFEEDGNCFLPYDFLISKALEFLEVEILEVEKALEVLEKENQIVIDKEKIYLRDTYEDERFVAEKLNKIKSYKIKNIFESYDWNKKIYELSSRVDVVLDDDQKDAIKSALYEKIMVITGSPGTGKSTIVNFILNIFEYENMSVYLSAPTGRASKRLSETTGKEAKTLHRLLEYNPKSNSFNKNKYNKLKCDLLVIDESSMIDIKLARILLDAMDEKTRIIFVGDYDQLPSVGPGNVLSDIINSGRFPVIRLTKIYRQFGKSIIIRNAHLIRDGIYPKLYQADMLEKSDFYFIEKNDQEEAVKVILKLLQCNIPDKFGFDPLKDIQVLVPVYKGIAGVDNLNFQIQNIFNKSREKIIRGNNEFRLYDKIIQLKNDYEKDVFNGDIGFIKEIDFSNQKFKVDFEEKKVIYDFYDADQLSLSYAISIHKSQGSEFKCVIIPVLTSHYMLLQRNLVYTALTRAKELAVVVGSKKAIGMAVSKNYVENRFTNLKNLL